MNIWCEDDGFVPTDLKKSTTISPHQNGKSLNHNVRFTKENLPKIRIFKSKFDKSKLLHTIDSAYGDIKISSFNVFSGI